MAPTSEELEQIQKMDTTSAAELKKATLKSAADAEISWRQDAVDAEIATAEEAAALSEWKKYRALMIRIKTDAASYIDWPISLMVGN
ncbi:tail fiber assembly protein [Escherichia coli]|uniref:tail fiber assembly protein n=1 Tax=Escherichia coli TaxID=562 RepID=UPI0039898B50